MNYYCNNEEKFYSLTYALLLPYFLVPEEVKILEREYFNRWYSLKAYYMVTLFSTIPPLVSPLLYLTFSLFIHPSNFNVTQ